MDDKLEMALRMLRHIDTTSEARLAREIQSAALWLAQEQSREVCIIPIGPVAPETILLRLASARAFGCALAKSGDAVFWVGVGQHVHAADMCYLVLNDRRRQALDEQRRATAGVLPDTFDEDFLKGWAAGVYREISARVLPVARMTLSAYHAEVREAVNAPVEFVNERDFL